MILECVSIAFSDYRLQWVHSFRNVRLHSTDPMIYKQIFRNEKIWGPGKFYEMEFDEYGTLLHSREVFLRENVVLDKVHTVDVTLEHFFRIDQG